MDYSLKSSLPRELRIRFVDFYFNCASFFLYINYQGLTYSVDRQLVSMGANASWLSGMFKGGRQGGHIIPTQYYSPPDFQTLRHAWKQYSVIGTDSALINFCQNNHLLMQDMILKRSPQALVFKGILKGEGPKLVFFECLRSHKNSSKRTNKSVDHKFKYFDTN